MHSRLWPLSAFAFVLAVVCSPSASAQEANALLEEVRDRHRATLEAIRTLTYSYEWQQLKSEPVHSENPGPVGMAGSSVGPTPIGPVQWWQSPDAQRSRTRWSDGSTTDDVFRFGRLLSIKAPKNIDPEHGVEIKLRMCSIHEFGLHPGLIFAHETRDWGFVPFHSLLQQPHQLRCVERLPAKSGGPPGDIRVELAHDHNVYEFRFSPSHNYLIRKRVTYPADEPHHRYEQEVSEFIEPNPGQFFPQRIEHRSFERGELKLHIRRISSDVQLNRPLPADAFRIPGIDGGWCEDTTMNVGFHVDADGYRIGKSQPTRSAVMPESPAAPRLKPPAETPVSLWFVLAIAILALCLCAAIFEIRYLRAELRKVRVT